MLVFNWCNGSVVGSIAVKVLLGGNIIIIIIKVLLGGNIATEALRSTVDVLLPSVHFWFRRQ